MSEDKRILCDLSDDECNSLLYSYAVTKHGHASVRSYCNDLNLWGKTVGEALSTYENEPRHGSHLVCYVYPDGGDADYEAFDTEAEAVERYEALVGFGYSSVTLAKPVRSTDYDCEGE